MQLDYKTLGVKIGLEIHQQIDSNKLFCSCPSIIRDDEPDVVVTRKLRASAGETGEIDVAAEYEMRKDRHFVYHAYNDTVCAVELDEEPIHNLNEDALRVILQAAKVVGANVVDSVQVMRKTVVDGSNTAGFQRTALVAMNGFVETNSGRISIPTICIEEESAKIVDASSDFVVYNLSRLGIPLIEIATAPEIRSPEQVMEVAEHIGMILRSTGRVKRGLGTIRQDLNVSIEGGARVEIKGAQELKLLQKLAEVEVTRQKNLVEVASELKKRKAGVSEKIVDITALLKDSSSEIIKEAIGGGRAIIATRLKGFSGLIRKELVPDTRLGKEFSSYARIAAGVGGAIHSDELPKHGITEMEVEVIREKLGCREEDAFIFVAAEREKAEEAIRAIIGRAATAIVGVPSEVRKANPDGTTSFLRPMPGSARMYPETDITAITPDTGSIELPELITDKAEKYEKLGLSKVLARQMSKSEEAGLFETLVQRFKSVEPSFIAETILSTGKEIMTRYNLAVEVTADDLEAVFGSMVSGRISRDAVFEIFVEKARGKSLKEALERYRLLSDDELEGEVKSVIAANKALPLPVLIGKAMEKLRGRAEGKKIVELVRKIAKFHE
ncbi:Glu-tRNA(Gln) amidotransferase subunit GatE [Candidatus Woesearchaeota archaeon]|nr:Glu-tRNA(Gln) amidotransferase subunit GatE [Candidatus Woesearchaeota archaeon]